ncbi:DUF3025 domain-containing protein [Caenimonas aquaedulcis]|uniref:DUF3025 domain-containing protein n=1 Tax=Caenimonas aquaedulcis TaxID=2793270 RepID=A0A931H741_9BURK|nr:DUF3025 domain-containing protein [Caenimonas aquaedulcis]MBG9389904.1 DUF3025 domain-containing protein [Caenimonas aquaedulcis]
MAAARWHDALSVLDSGAPWFEPWRTDGARVVARVQGGAALHDALNDGGLAPVRFTPASALPPGVPYERHVFEARSSPVREGLHDFFNGLAWRAWPLAKARLNAVHAGHIAAHGTGAARGPVRDAATLFDENGAILHAPAVLWEALEARDWRRLFMELRPVWKEARLTIVGHALLEKLVRPRKNLTAHVWAAPAPAGGANRADPWLASQLTPERLAVKPFMPLPVMGVPGWAPQNADFSFYDDARVFRPARQQESRPSGPTTTSPPVHPPA